MRNPLRETFVRIRDLQVLARDGLSRRRRAAAEACGRAASVLGITPGGALLSLSILLVTIGTVMVFSASFFHRSVDGDAFFFLRRQLLYLPLAILGGVLAYRLDYRILARLHWPLLGFTAVLLGLVFVPGVGLMFNGARRWIRLGNQSWQFQPSELAKLSVVVFLAGFLARNPDRLKIFWKGFVPICAVLAVIAGLVLMEPDFGTALFILLVAAVVLVIAGIRKRFIFLSGLLAAAPIAAFMMWRWEKIQPRLMAFVDPEGFHQVRQALIAMGAGGFGGSGLGAGAQKLKFLPEPQTDFIFAVIGEELGFLGSVGVILLFVAFLLAGAAVARRSRDWFGFLLASGIILALSIQAAINIMVVTASGPTKGIPLPFITFGRSGLIVSLIQVGLLLSIDRLAHEPAAVTASAAVPAPPEASPAPAPLAPSGAAMEGGAA